MAAKQDKKKTFRQSLRYPTWMSRKNCGPTRSPRSRGQGGAWTSPPVAVTGTQTSTGREGADKPSCGTGTFFPTEQARILLQVHCINADTTRSLDFRMHTASLPHLSAQSKDLPHHQQVRPPPPRIHGDLVGSRSPPPQATARSLPTGVSAGLNQGPWTSAFSGL